VEGGGREEMREGEKNTQHLSGRLKKPGFHFEGGGARGQFWGKKKVLPETPPQGGLPVLFIRCKRSREKTGR